jgi:hypothetical protein
MKKVGLESLEVRYESEAIRLLRRFKPRLRPDDLDLLIESVAELTNVHDEYVEAAISEIDQAKKKLIISEELIAELEAELSKKRK